MTLPEAVSAELASVTPQSRRGPRPSRRDHCASWRSGRDRPPGVAEALQATRARRALVANLMTEPGETAGMGAVDHVRAVPELAGPVVDGVLFNSAPLDATRLDRYARTGAEPVPTDLERIRALGLVPVEADLLRTGRHLRHDSRKLGKALLSVVAGHC